MSGIFSMMPPKILPAAVTTLSPSRSLSAFWFMVLLQISLLAALASSTVMAEDFEDPRLKELSAALEHRYQQNTHQAVSARFQQLVLWFSPREMQLMGDGKSGLAIKGLNGGQSEALHSFLTEILPSTGYLRLIALTGMASVQSEIQRDKNELPPTTLSLRQSEDQQELIIRGPTLSVVFRQSNDQWQTSSLSLRQWPATVPPAPEPGLTENYPYLHWHNTQGQKPLQQPAGLALRLITSLTANNQTGSCLGTLQNAGNCSLAEWPNVLPEKLALSRLHGEEKYLAQRLLEEFQSHTSQANDDEEYYSVLGRVGSRRQQPDGQPQKQSVILVISYQRQEPHRGLSGFSC